jgi:hypothetical protein
MEYKTTNFEKLTVKSIYILVITVVIFNLSPIFSVFFFVFSLVLIWMNYTEYRINKNEFKINYRFKAKSVKFDLNQIKIERPGTSLFILNYNWANVRIKGKFVCRYRFDSENEYERFLENFYS